MRLIPTTRATVIWRIVVVAVLLFLLLFSLETFRECWACRCTLGNGLWYSLRQYRLYHEGHYPQDIGSVAAACYGDRVETNANVLLILPSCPGARTHLSLATTNGSLRSDYIYINWEPYFGTNAVPTDYPVFYDRHLANHWWLGVNVCTTSREFWDFRAHWLRDFSSRHPEYHLLIPD